MHICAINGIVITRFGDHIHQYLQYDGFFLQNYKFLEATLEKKMELSLFLIVWSFPSFNQEVFTVIHNTSIYSHFSESTGLLNQVV